ncbi:hypothetical protein [Hyphomonas sp.]|uniref:hypothetical protein n=1 Tax=Hyphomonas sp. TaxID=87 RepID=UPI00391A528C
MTDTERLQELETLAKAANAAPAETLAKCDALIEDLVKARIAEGHDELSAHRHVLSDAHPVGSKLYKLSTQLSEQIAYQDRIFLG